MIARTTRLCFAALLLPLPLVAGQAAPPKLDKAQRTMLQAIVSAVDTATMQPEPATPVDWRIHLLRASDGSHYVAFSAPLPAAIAPKAPATLYVRLATRRDPQLVTSTSERSAVMEWLKGVRTDPRLAPKRGGIALGEMPVYGAGSAAVRGPAPQGLAILEFERERAREQKEARERQRKSELEGTASSSTRDAVYPFEDFAFAVPPSATADGVPILRRSLTAGPGDYDLYLAWSDAKASDRTPRVSVIRTSLRLAPASTSELALSSVILADSVKPLETPYAPDAQTAHPYAIGASDITPAADDVFTNDEALKVFYQIINPRASPDGKPDVAITLRLSRITATGDQAVGTLNPQYYNASTLPADFDLAKGHPVFAATSVPLAKLPRASYRLSITGTDRLAGTEASADALFRLAATPVTLLRDAPFGHAYDRESVLTPATLGAIVAALRPATPSTALGRALDALAERRFIDLLREDPVEPSEQSVRTALRGIGLYVLGDPRLAGTILGQARQQSAPEAAVQFFIGACRALEANDRDAVSAWQSALDRGLPAAVVRPLLVDAYLRLGDPKRAGELARLAMPASPREPVLARGLAAAHIAAGQESAAIAALDTHLATHADDAHGQFLLLHALFAEFVHGRGVGGTAVGQDRFKTLAKAYIDAGARHAALVKEWLEVMP